VKPVAFAYERPADIATAIALADSRSIAAKFIAGGQSLGPMLNLRLAQPDLLVDLTAIDELRAVDESADALLLGACITHADIEDGRVPDIARGALSGVARAIAYRAVRNRGTIGGSLAHADPAADWIACLAALGASVVIEGTSGRRAVSIEDFVVGVFETTLTPNEVVAAVSIPRVSPLARWGYYRICRKAGDFAHAIGAVLCDPDRAVCRAVMGATETRPIVLTDARALFGGTGGGDLAASFDTHVAMRALDVGGLRDPIDRQLHLVALRRAVERARAS
jgi:carbon-monoxide dehydrogenase medium subunit